MSRPALSGRPIAARLGPFGHRAFAIYWAGGMFSNIGTWIQNVAGSVYIFDLTHSAFAVGVLNFATFVPILLFSVSGGILSDRFDRRAIVIALQSVSLVIASALAIAVATGAATEVHIIVTAFLLQTSWSIAKPSMIAILPALVPRPLLAEAVGLNTLQFIGGQIAGPVLTTLVLASAGYAWAFGINAATFVGPILAMAYLYRRDLGRGVARGSARADAVGLSIGSYIRAKPWVVWALLAVISTSAMLEVVRTTAPAFVVQRLGLPSTDTGLLIAALSTGSALGLLAFIPLRRWDISRTLPFVGLTVQGVGLAITSVATTLPVAAVSVAAIGLGFSFCFPIVTGTLQTEVPDAIRGRLMSIHQMAHLGNRPFAALAAGAIAASFSLTASSLAGVALVPLGLFSVRALWRGLGRPGAARPEPAVASTV